MWPWIRWLPVAVLCWTVSFSAGHVTRVIDGDTFALSALRVWPGVAAVDERVRVLGVDAPERGQPKFEEAKAFAEGWIAKGQATLKTCKRDSFGRLLADITRDGESLADALVAVGLGRRP